MTERPPDLPDYHRPPIDEVAISVQFPPIGNFFDTHAGLFWQRVRSDYPKSETQPRIESPIESAESGALLTVPFNFAPGQGRVWMISANDDFLIQIQNTRFVQNWRRRQAEYRHFEQIRDLFWRNFDEFMSFLADENLDQPSVQQLEVTYINWIPPDLAMSDFLRPGNAAQISLAGLGRYPDQQSWIARFSFPGTEDLIERLYVQCLPASRHDAPSVQGSQFALTMRMTRATGISTEELRNLIDAARITIVTAFTDLTTDRAHELWQQFQ